MTGINFQILTKEVLLERINDLINISKDVNHDNWQESHYLSDLPEKWRYSLACFFNETLLGYLIASRKNPYEVHIHKYIINQSFRGKGVGEKLFHEFLKNLDRSVEKITLKVYQDNPGATKFYERQGFIVTGTDKDMFQMELKLN